MQSGQIPKHISTVTDDATGQDALNVLCTMYRKFRWDTRHELTADDILGVQKDCKHGIRWCKFGNPPGMHFEVKAVIGQDKVEIQVNHDWQRVELNKKKGELHYGVLCSNS